MRGGPVALNFTDTFWQESGSRDTELLRSTAPFYRKYISNFIVHDARVTIGAENSTKSGFEVRARLTLCWRKTR